MLSIWFTVMVAAATVEPGAAGLQRCSAVENDIARLACFDDLAAATAELNTVDTVAAPSLTRAERIHRAVDQALASELADPLDATSYQVSEPLACAAIDARHGGPGDTCVCYSVRSRSAGGRAGTGLRSIRLKETAPGVWTTDASMEIVDAGSVRACHRAIMGDRPSDMIRLHVNR